MKLLVFCLLAIPLMSATAFAENRPRFALAIHGGAGEWNIDEPLRKELRDTLSKALTDGRDTLTAGGSSLDVVETVIRLLEDTPAFNAGKGATFNAAGQHELDASIMDGDGRASGAVAGLRVAKNPISVARLVMSDTKHVLFTGDGADEFATMLAMKNRAVELVKPDYFWTPHRRQQWKQQQTEADDHHGTVGCVALDTHGNLAAGTSTGGMKNKRFGRVGDSPLIGSGTWADNATCAISCTGHGELFIRNQVAYDIAARVAYGKSDLETAVHHQLHKRLKPGDGGLIAIGSSGEIVLDFNTKAMPRAAADSSGRFEVVVDE